MTAVVAEPASARHAALWRLLSIGFAPPTTETIEEVEALAGALADEGPPELAAVLAQVSSARAEILGSQYTRLFSGRVRVAPYEGSYERDPIRQGRQLADVAGFYRAFGAEAGGPAAERPDHAGCELEFLSFLELRRVDATEADGQLLDGILDAFLADHAGRWLPTFFAEVRSAAVSAPFYDALAALGMRVLSEELKRREVTPAPLPSRAARLSVEADAFDCGAAAATP